MNSLSDWPVYCSACCAPFEDIYRGWLMIFPNMLMLLSKPTSIGSSCTQNISSTWFEADPVPAGKKAMAERCGKDAHAVARNQCHATSYLQSVNWPNESRLISMPMNIIHSLNRRHFVLFSTAMRCDAQRYLWGCSQDAVHIEGNTTTRSNSVNPEQQ